MNAPGGCRSTTASTDVARSRSCRSPKPASASCLCCVRFTALSVVCARFSALALSCSATCCRLCCCFSNSACAFACAFFGLSSVLSVSALVFSFNCWFFAALCFALAFASGFPSGLSFRCACAFARSLCPLLSRPPRLELAEPEHNRLFDCLSGFAVLSFHGIALRKNHEPNDFK